MCDSIGQSSLTLDWINLARSTISYFLCDFFKLSEDVFVKRLFRYFYVERPLKARYVTFWPVSKLLELLSSWHPLENLDLRKLTLKTVALISLTSSDRGQSVHLANVKNTVVKDDSIEFVIFDRIKTTRKILKPIVIKCVSSDIDELNVCKCVKEYLSRTNPHRNSEANNFQLFVSWKNFKAVTKQSISRWLLTTLSLAGIDTGKYKAHSFRGAGLSHAYSKGVPLEKIVEAGRWSNSNTFRTYYCAPSDTSDVGRIILGH